MDDDKKQLGQYFTKRDVWLKNNIKEFILKSKCTIAYDPFAGSGDLLSVASKLGFNKTIGLDIDRNLGWRYNDSLTKIPHIKDAIIITNPPYLTDYSAKRKQIWKEVEGIFRLTEYDNLYLLALDNMLKAQDFVVAIVPETFINTKFPKDRVNSINVLEENPFDDTENPVSIVCFDNKSKSPYDIKVYKNAHFSSTLGDLLDKQLTPNKKYKIKFNCPSGLIALRAVDTTDPKRRIKFMQKHQLDYDLKGIKKSSRLITVIDVKLNTNLENYIELCNKILNKYREDTDDILLSPFKGNMKNGIRRRRLDYKVARAIMETALNCDKNITDYQRKFLAIENS